MDKRDYVEAASRCKMFATETRLAILHLLIDNPGTSVSAMTTALGESSQPAVSHHLMLLKAMGLVSYDRQGKENLYYVVETDAVRSLFNAIGITGKVNVNPARSSAKPAKASTPKAVKPAKAAKPAKAKGSKAPKGRKAKVATEYEASADEATA